MGNALSGDAPQLLAPWQASASWAIKADTNLDYTADANWP